MAFRRTIAEISLSAISSNLDKVRSIAGRRKIMAIVKASAYGHGTIPVVERLIAGGVDMLGVANVEEGVELRDAGISHPIVVLSGIVPDEIPAVIEYNLTPVIYNLPLVRSLSRLSSEKGKTTNIHIKIDTGMSRLGIIDEEAVEIIKEIAELKGIRLEGIMTHFADADLDKEYTVFQLKRFNNLIEGLKRIGINFPLCHAANSAAILTLRASLLDMLRPGIMLYGYLPSEQIHSIALKPALTLKSHILFIKRIPAGTPVSYGRTFITKRASSIAIVPVGYADGYNRLLSNRGEVLIKGERAPVIGRVCMDMTMVDVTDISGVREGDEVVLIGRQGEGFIGADEIAKKIGTIPYEILCSISSRVPRVYKE